MEITATAMVSPAGLSAAASCAAIRARIARFGETRFRDRQGEPVVGAAVPRLSDPGLDPPTRLAALLAEAVHECLAGETAMPIERVPLFVGLAEPGRPGGGAELADSIVHKLEQRLGRRFAGARSQALACGHTAGFECLKLARESLQDPGIPACLVCGVDSYLNAESLGWLEEHGRLKMTGNPDGVIPGEAAAAVLVRRPGASRGHRTCRVAGLGFGHETAAVLEEAPLLGLGLAEATRAALAEAQRAMHEIDFRLSDVTGESYGMKEQALVVSRLMRSGRADFPIWHCADAIGDTGAAAGICQLVLASAAFRKGYAPGEWALGFTSAAAGDRAVAVLQQLGG